MAGKLIKDLTAASGGELVDTSVLAGSAAAGTEARKFTIDQIKTIMDVVETGAITTSGLTTTGPSMLGRDDADTGAVKEITVGTNLLLSAGVLSANNQSQSIIVACSDLVSSITAGTNKGILYIPYDFKLEYVFAGLLTPQSSGNIFTVDINRNGSTILSTKITIDNTEETSFTAAVQPALNFTNLLQADRITFDVDQVGNGTAIGLLVGLVGAMP